MTGIFQTYKMISSMYLDSTDGRELLGYCMGLSSVLACLSCVYNCKGPLSISTRNVVQHPLTGSSLTN